MTNPVVVGLDGSPSAGLALMWAAAEAAPWQRARSPRRRPVPGEGDVAHPGAHWRLMPRLLSTGIGANGSPTAGTPP